MTFIITATFAFTAVYTIAAFIHHSMASIRRRRKETITQTVSEVVEAIATVEPEEVAPAIELPNSIRGLRQFVRENTLQARVKEIAGKSVSKLNKSELHQAVTMAIA